MHKSKNVHEIMFTIYNYIYADHGRYSLVT